MHIYNKTNWMNSKKNLLHFQHSMISTYKNFSCFQFFRLSSIVFIFNCLYLSIVLNFQLLLNFPLQIAFYLHLSVPLILDSIIFSFDCFQSRLFSPSVVYSIIFKYNYFQFQLFQLSIVQLSIVQPSIVFADNYLTFNGVKQLFSL